MNGRLALLLTAACIGCGDDPVALDRTPPVLAASPLDLTGPYDPDRDAFGDVTFTFRDALIPFGGDLGGGRPNCGFEYYTTLDATVRAASSGVVVRMVENDGQMDHEIEIRPVASSAWSVLHDHVTDPLVARGDRVAAGDVLGGTGHWSASLGRTELSVTLSEDERHGISYCPCEYADPEFLRQHEALLAAVNARGFGPYESLCLVESCVP